MAGGILLATKMVMNIPIGNFLMKSRTYRLHMMVLFTVFSPISQAGEDKNPGTRGTLEIRVVDKTGKTLPARIYLTNHKGEAFAPENRTIWDSAFISPGNDAISLPPGNYTIISGKGPEWNVPSAAVSLRSGETIRKTMVMNRRVNMSEAGWYGGDLHIHRPMHEMDLIMKAEDLDMASLQTWWNESNIWDSASPESHPPNPVFVVQDGRKKRILHVMSGEDERAGGAVLYHRLTTPVDITGSSPEYPPSTAWFNEVSRLGGWLEIEKPFWWDTPTWLATGQIRSIGIAHNHIQRNGMLDNEAWGRARDRSQFPGPHGNGLYTQELYYRILNCGFRIPPSAGSASGVLPNPVGYNRVYVYCGDSFTWDSWWNGFQSGKAFVTNGPLLKLSADSRLPGHEFRFSGNRFFPPSIIIEGTIDSMDAIDRVELVYNGKISPVELPLNFRPEVSGWFLIRVITKVENTFRFASSAPWYVEFVDNPFQPQSNDVTFFLNWINQRIGTVRNSNISDPDIDQALEPHLNAHDFWSGLLK